LLTARIVPPKFAFAACAVTRKQKMKKTISRTLHGSFVAFFLASQVADAKDPSQALSRDLSNGAASALAGSAFVVAGSIATIGAAGNFVVASVTPVAEGSVVVLKAVGEGVGQVVAGGAELSINVGKGAIVASGVVVGTALTVIKETAGWALTANGKLVGYVVNEEGAALLRQKRLS
jgi:hypothetical protein